MVHTVVVFIERGFFFIEKKNTCRKAQPPQDKRVQSKVGQLCS